MIRIPLKYSGKTIFVSPYTTFLEREILILSEISETPNIDGILDILKDNIVGDVDNLSMIEKVSILFKVRSLSIGEEIGVKFQCPECKAPNENNINISSIIVPGEEHTDIKPLFKDVTDENIQEFVDYAVDELDIGEYDELMTRIERSQTLFNTVISTPCVQCKQL